MRTVIFTRTGFHHTCFINRLIERFDIVCVVREAYSEQTEKKAVFSAFRGLFRKKTEAQALDAQFLKEFTETYSAGFRYHPLMKDYLKADFDVVAEKQDTKYLNIRCGEINDPGIRGFIRSLRPDVIAVLGSSVIGKDLISIPSTAMINIHSGLSPYYRGTWSYGWPIVNREPEYIGVTLHHINEGIDTGDIIFQTKPLLERGDDLNSIFLKVIAEGIELMVKAIDEISNKGSIVSHAQSRDTGRLYRTKDLDADMARICLNNLNDGLIGEYLSEKESRDSGVKLCCYIPPLIFQ